MRRDWLSPLVWVPTVLLVCGAMGWSLIALSLVSDSNGALCGSVLHWYSGSATSTGGEVSPAQRAAQNGACHRSAVSRVHAADWALAAGAAAAGIAVASLTLRRRLVVHGT